MKKVLLIGASGYVGSYLKKYFEKKTSIELSTCDIRLGQDGPHTYNASHSKLDKNQLSKYQVVLFFAGCSSVKQAELNPSGAIEQNVTELLALRRKLSDNTYLIYASSASVYSDIRKYADVDSESPDELSPLPASMNVYDASKKSADILLPFLTGISTSLRLGTVCGYSPGFRKELVFNSMVSTAMKKQNLQVSNKMNWRPILFLEDLAGMVNTLVEKSDDAPNLRPEIVNLASTSLTIEMLARRIADYFDVGIEYGDDSPSYNIKMNTGLADSIRNPTFISVEHQAELLKNNLLLKSSLT